MYCTVDYGLTDYWPGGLLDQIIIIIFDDQNQKNYLSVFFIWL